MLIIVFLVLVLRRAGSKKSKAGEDRKAAEAKKKSSSIALKAGFYRALFRLRRTFSVRDFRYKVPWVVGLGTRPQAESLLANSGVSLPFGPPPAGDTSGSSWWFCDGGVFLEVPGAASSAEDGAATWKRVLGELVDHRPERPVDSLLLTVSSRELRAARKDATGRQELEKAADVLYERVWEAQRRLGLRLPVYLVVTDCEKLPGFAHLSGRLREVFRRQIFGWSNPYSLDTKYRSDWVTEAFGELGERLRRVLIELFTQRPPAVGADQIFLFPRELRSLEAPLRRFADRVFKPSSYHEAMMLRGIFFTGAEEEAAEPHVEGLEDSDLPLALEERPQEEVPNAFLLELVEKKIFPEGSLAQPTAGRLRSRSRSVRIAQALLAVTALGLGLGVWAAYSKLAHSNRVLVPFLQKFSRDLANTYTVRSRGLPMDHQDVTQRASHFAEGLSKIDIRQYRSVFLPISWFDPVDGDLRQTMSIGFEQVIAEALRLELERRAEDLLSTSRRAAPGAAETDVFRVLPAARGERKVALPVEETLEFAKLRRFVDELYELDRNQRLFNSLRQQDGGELERLAFLVTDLFSYELPQGFFAKSSLYTSALGGSGYQGFSTRKFESRVEERVRTLSFELDQALYENSSLVTTLEDLRGRLDSLRNGSWLEREGRQVIDATVALLGEADDLVSSGAVSWIFARQFNLGPAYEETLALAAGTEFLSRSSAAEESQNLVLALEQSSEAGWLSLRRSACRAAFAPSEVTGPLLERDGDEVLLPALSPDVQVLYAALLEYRSKRFLMEAGAGTTQPSLIVTLPAGSLRRWDNIYLEQAISLYEAYLSFTEGSLQEFPEGVREPLALVARRGLYHQMSDFIRQAQTFAAQPVASDPRLQEQSLREEVEFFQAAAEALNRLLVIFEELQFFEAELQLERVFLGQGARFLSQIDGLLRAKELYQPQEDDFSWWNGNGNLAFESFGVADEADLVAFLDLQRAQVRNLGRNLAQPVVNSLGSDLVRKSPETQALHLGWQEILVALEDYDTKKPGNSVARLETLIQSGMSKATLADCAAAPVEAPKTGVRTNFFASRDLDLRRGLYRRCVQLSAEQALKSYGQVAEFFNRNLAGRYPFLEEDPGSEDVVADVEVLRQFFDLFDPAAEPILAIPPDHPRFLGQGPRVQGFVRQMGDVRTFLSPFVGPSEADPGEGASPPARPNGPRSGGAPKTQAQVPIYDLRAEFRVNREREEGAKQIIRWVLGIGEEELSHRDAEPEGRWIFGQPLRLSLAWASDAPVVPQAEESVVGTWVEDRTVIFERQGPWALLSFLQDFRSPAEDFSDFADPRPHTLKFPASTVPRSTEEESEEAPVTAPAPEPVAVYVRLVVLDPGTKEPLELPFIPAWAPVLPKADGQGSGSTAGGIFDGV